jgi:hypothetical protein
LWKEEWFPKDDIIKVKYESGYVSKAQKEVEEFIVGGCCLAYLAASLLLLLALYTLGPIS